jgi:hypothetical protein
MKAVFILIGVIVSIAGFGQTMLSGTVKDETGAPVMGANVFIKDSYDGTSSAADGSFSFSTEEKGSQLLLVTFVGFRSFEQPVELTEKFLTLHIVLKEAINQMDGVVITAGSFTAGEEGRRTILKALDIATTAGATADIAGALNTLPGTQKVGEEGRLFVRGGDGSETRTFIDGMVVLDPYGPAAPNTPSRGRFLPFMFKGTSFSTGGYSAEYGQALSSALVLNSKDIAEMNQTDIGILSVGADVAHTQTWQRASVAGKVGYTNLRPYFGLVQQELDWHTPPVSYESSAAYRQRVGKDGLLKFFGNFNSSSFSQYIHGIDNPATRYRFDRTNRYAYGNGNYQQSLSTLWSVRGGISWSQSQNEIAVDGQPLDELEKGLHTKLVFEHSASDQLEIRFGGEHFDRTFSTARFNQAANERVSNSFTEPLSVAFAEAEYYVTNRFVVKAGGRAEHNGLSNQTAVDPRLALAYKPGKNGQFSFAYGTFRQSALNQFLQINTHLQSEKAEHFILNYQVITNRRTFRVETYYKQYTELIKVDQESPATLRNTGSGYARGLEFFFRDNQTITNADYWISYSFLDTERDYLAFPAAAVPTFASRHNFSFVYKHFIPAIKSQLGFTYSYSSGRTYFNPNKPLSEFLSDRTPAYQDLSANLSYLPKNFLIIYVSCTNLLGRENIFGYQYGTVPDAAGVYASRPIGQPAPRFLFLGVFITLSKNKSVNQLPNL